MSMPFYVAPEQQMKDRADFARKGIARGRSVIVMHYADGILFVAENRSQALHKVSEIYDRLGFAAVGRYNEFENLRQAGIRYADLRGYSYDRTDVTGRGLANAYAQLLGTIFSSGGEKPYEVEIIVAELGATQELDQIYRLTYDGSVGDEQDFAVMGGSADVITEVVKRGFSHDLSLTEAARLAVSSLGADGGPNAEPRTLGVEALEVAILDRSRTRPRKFRRIAGERLAALLNDAGEPVDPGTEAPPTAPVEPAVTETDLTPGEPSP
ncbi:MAG: proteasome subunit alpha [Propionibacteriaceae bacterium]